MGKTAKSYPYAFHVALDGNGINGLEGLAGVCLFLFDPKHNHYGYKIEFFDGIAGGHTVSVNRSGTIGFLGNTAQHLLFYDARTLVEVVRISTLRFETPTTSLQGSTHVVWLSDDEIVTPIGEYFYRFKISDLERPTRLNPHLVKLPHGMKRTASGRYIVYGSMDSPAGSDGEARQVGIWDLETNEITVLTLPATCWHVVCASQGTHFLRRLLPRCAAELSRLAQLGNGVPQRIRIRNRCCGEKSAPPLERGPRGSSAHQL